MELYYTIRSTRDKACQGITIITIYCTLDSMENISTFRQFKDRIF